MLEKVVGFSGGSDSYPSASPKIRRESRKLGFILYEAFYWPIVFVKVEEEDHAT